MCSANPTHRTGTADQVSIITGVEPPSCDRFVRTPLGCLDLPTPSGMAMFEILGFAVVSMAWVALVVLGARLGGTEI